MTDPIDLRPASEQLAHLIHNVRDDQLGLETPCAGWRVSDLILHIDDLSGAFTAAAQKRSEESTTKESPVNHVLAAAHRIRRSDAPAPGYGQNGLTANWRNRIAEQLTVLADAWGNDDAMVGEAEAGGVRMAAAELAVVALDELVLHSWDLARATGQDFHVSNADAAICLGFADAMSEPEQAESREGLYGPVVRIHSAAPPLFRLLGAAGRDPSWQPRRHDDDTALATFVLVPGAWTDAQIWGNTADSLRAVGHRVHTLTLDGLHPGLTPGQRASVRLIDHVDQVMRLIEQEDLHNVILVSHSYSGIVVGQVADRIPERIRRSIHVGAFLPRDGRSLVDDWGDDEAARDAERQDIRDDGMLWAPPPIAALITVRDLEPVDVEGLLAGVVEHPGHTVLEPARLADPVTTQRITFVATTEDDEAPYGELPPELSIGVPGGWRVQSVGGGHWPMVCVPAQLDRLLREECRTTRIRPD